MKWPKIKPAGEISFSFELMLGRFAMIATLALFVVREAPGYRFLDSPTRLALAGAAVALAATWICFWLFLAARPDTAWHGLCVVVIVACATVLVWERQDGLYPFYYAAVLSGAAYRWRIGTVLAIATTGYATLAWWAFGMASPWSAQSVVMTALLGGASVLVRRYVGVQLELQEARDEVRRLAAAEARAQLARDLHDQLGQNLTTAVMQGELLDMDLSDTADESVRRRVRIVVDTSRDALALMRQMVTELRTPGLRSESALAGQLLESVGIACSITVPTIAMPEEVDQALGWVVREAVTNTMRHSGARHCCIDLRAADQGLELRVTDDGTGAGESNDGCGLVHMRERLAAIGGSVRVKSSAGNGFELIARAPVRVDKAVPA